MNTSKLNCITCKSLEFFQLIGAAIHLCISKLNYGLSKLKESVPLKRTLNCSDHFCDLLTMKLSNAEIFIIVHNPFVYSISYNSFPIYETTFLKQVPILRLY